MKKFIMGIALAFISCTAYANPNLQNEFCGDRYCGQSQMVPEVKRTVTYKKKRAPPIQVASIGETSMGGLVSQARSYMGQTAHQIGVRSSLWCSAFLRKITGASGVDDRAISWLNKPRTIASVGAIAVMRHHVGVVSGFDSKGNPILISGNHGRKVGEGVYSKARIIAYVTP